MLYIPYTILYYTIYSILVYYIFHTSILYIPYIILYYIFHTSILYVYTNYHFLLHLATWLLLCVYYTQYTSSYFLYIALSSDCFPCFCDSLGGIITYDLQRMKCEYKYKSLDGVCYFPTYWMASRGYIGSPVAHFCGKDSFIFFGAFQRTSDRKLCAHSCLVLHSFRKKHKILKYFASILSDLQPKAFARLIP